MMAQLLVNANRRVLALEADTSLGSARVTRGLER
jgi:hypothetical protein